MDGYDWGTGGGVMIVGGQGFLLRMFEMHVKREKYFVHCVLISIA
jgi:hypothetical protein